MHIIRVANFCTRGIAINNARARGLYLAMLDQAYKCGRVKLCFDGVYFATRAFVNDTIVAMLDCAQARGMSSLAMTWCGMSKFIDCVVGDRLRVEIISRGMCAG